MTGHMTFIPSFFVGNPPGKWILVRWNTSWQNNIKTGCIEKQIFGSQVDSTGYTSYPVNISMTVTLTVTPCCQSTTS
jgi:hypothetical protein